MRHQFRTSQWVPYSPDLVFAFFADPRNLPPLMPRWQAARIESMKICSPSGARAESGGIVAGTGSTMLITFRPVPLSPIRLSWRAVIAEFSSNDHFCDEQQSGPFRYWRHCHRVKEELHGNAGGTLATDNVEYEMKLGAAGEVADALFFARQIEKLFNYRQRQLLKLLETFHSSSLGWGT